MNYKRLIISLALPQLAGMVGSLFTISAIPTWYATLQRPSFSPPNWLFGPAWVTLYILMGISVYLIWQKIEQNPPSLEAEDGHGKTVRGALWLFWIHLFFNAIWSIIFFGLQNPGLAFINIIIIWLFIIALIIKFWKIKKLASLLLIPYFLWVSFASLLNYSVWQLNKELAGSSDAGLIEQKQNLIQVENIKPNQKIVSPLFVGGKARGYWYFEASFPIKLYDENGELLATAITQAQSDWMTEDFVEFRAELKFEPPETETGFLVLEKDNPSGLSENDDELRIPVVFAKQTGKINLYYYSPDMDKDETGNTMCSRAGLAAVEREIPITQTPIQDAIKLLLLGKLTKTEQEQGIGTEYPLEGFSLKGASLKDGVLTLEFDDSQNRTVGGSCRVGILWFQIEETAKQFPEVEQVKFMPEDIFQP